MRLPAAWAVRNGEAAILLVDSEDLVLPAYQLGDPKEKEDRSKWLPWAHLAARPGDGWGKPDQVEDRQCNLMVVCMETWFLADREALKVFYGHDFNENALPAAGREIETIPKSQVFNALKQATRNAKTKGQYGKASHSFKLLALIDANKVTTKSPWARRFVEYLEEVV